MSGFHSLDGGILRSATPPYSDVFHLKLESIHSLKQSKSDKSSEWETKMCVFHLVALRPNSGVREEKDEIGSDGLKTKGTGIKKSTVDFFFLLMHLQVCMLKFYSTHLLTHSHSVDSHNISHSSVL